MIVYQRDCTPQEQSELSRDGLKYGPTPKSRRYHAAAVELERQAVELERQAAGLRAESRRLSALSLDAWGYAR